jgi:hypothetical protein
MSETSASPQNHRRPRDTCRWSIPFRGIAGRCGSVGKSAPPRMCPSRISRLGASGVNHPGEQTIGVMTIHPTWGQPHRRADVGGRMTTQQSAVKETWKETRTC